VGCRCDNLLAMRLNGHVFLLTLALAAPVRATHLAPFIDLQETGLQVATDHQGIGSGFPVSLAADIGGSVRFALLYWAGSDQPASFTPAACDFATPCPDQEMVFDGTAITGTLIGSELWSDDPANARLAVGYFADVTSLASAHSGSSTFSITDGNPGFNLSDLDGFSLVLAYTDAADSALYRVLVWDGLDFATPRASGNENRTMSPVTFAHGAQDSPRQGQLTLIVGDGGAAGDRITIENNPDIFDSLDGLPNGPDWDGETRLIDIPAGVTSTAVDMIPEDDIGDFFSVTPCRIADTRSPVADPLAAGETRDFTAGNTCGLFPTATAVALIVTGVEAPGDGELQVFPEASPPPVPAMTVAVKSGASRANNGVVPLAGDGSGRIRVRNTLAAPIHVVIDTSGQFAGGDDLLWEAAVLRLPVPEPL
jgi:hypothetical protein